MSFIITVYTNEGIIMASDSRSTYTTTTKLPDGKIEKKIGVQITDTSYKTFQCNARIGLSTCGTASINNMPIAGYIEKFISQKVTDDSSVEEVSRGLLDFFSKFLPIPNTHFIVAGYNKGDTKQHVTCVYIASNQIQENCTDVPGAIWDGEIDVLRRLIKKVAVKNEDGTYDEQDYYNIGFNYFTLQDAIDFAQYAVDCTIKTMFFQDRVKTVGGPIDILVIKPDGAFWVQHKKLHA